MKHVSIVGSFNEELKEDLLFYLWGDFCSHYYSMKKKDLLQGLFLLVIYLIVIEIITVILGFPLLNYIGLLLGILIGGV